MVNAEPQKTCFHNAAVYTGFSVMNNCAVVVKHDKIVDVFSEGRFAKKEFDHTYRFVDLDGASIAPGLIDTHIHGIAGFGTDDADPKSILGMSEALAECGATAFLPTLYSGKKETMLAQIRAVVKAMGREKGARIAGIHLEGPFISPERLGVQKKSAVSPVDLGLMKELVRAAKGHIVSMTVAPELKDMRELALYCVGRGIVLQAGHTNATYAQMVEGMQARIMHATHLFNAMRGMHHRDPGAVGAVFIEPELSCEIIADGIHIDPNLVRLVAKYKPDGKIVLVTDSLKPTGQAGKNLSANGEKVYLDGAFHRAKDDTLAGSALTMMEGVRNLVAWGIPLDQALRMASTNPARIMRLEHKGMIAPGYDADLVIFDKNLNIVNTVVGGKLICA